VIESLNLISESLNLISESLNLVIESLNLIVESLNLVSESLNFPPVACSNVQVQNSMTQEVSAQSVTPHHPSTPSPHIPSPQSSSNAIPPITLLEQCLISSRAFLNDVLGINSTKGNSLDGFAPLINERRVFEGIVQVIAQAHGLCPESILDVKV